MNMPTMSTARGRPHPPDRAGDWRRSGRAVGLHRSGWRGRRGGCRPGRGRGHRQIVYGHHLSVARVRPSRGHPGVGRTSAMTNTAPRSDMRRGRAETELSDVPDVVVETVAGRVRGRSVHGVARFLGVPFAARPVGPLRFAAPAPAVAWAGVRDATAPGPNAPQPTRAIPGIDLPPIIGRGWRRSGADPDDYLTVDVWTPDPGGAGLPGAGVRARRGVHRGRAGLAHLRRHGAGARGRRARLGDLPARRRGLRRVRRRRDATSGCATSSPRSPGCRTTSRRSAATRAGSRCSASRRAR